ncbi:MAG: hypothetical protein EXR17_02980 [Flavobacteriaceae bacterium]|nr:hypothetical protein [Flavobacteriaceae bacterium]
MKKFFVFALLVFFFSSSIYSQCPMCKAALTSNRSHSKNKPIVGNGINKGILMLLATPYLLLGTAGLFYYQYKRKHAR